MNGRVGKDLFTGKLKRWASAKRCTKWACLTCFNFRRGL